MRRIARYWRGFKRTLWEVGTRVPCIVVAPGMGRPAQRCARPVSTIDLFPTLIELCALPKLTDLDGGLLACLFEHSEAPSEPAITVDENRRVAVRDDRYRYIRYRDGREELYDHVDDAPEWRNRANDPALGKVKDRLRTWIPEIFAKPARKSLRFRSACLPMDGQVVWGTHRRWRVRAVYKVGGL